MNKSPNLIGREFGYLTVLNKSGTPNRIMWACRCVCGTVVFRRTESLTRGKSYSCGCRQGRSNATVSHLDRFLYRHPANSGEISSSLADQPEAV